MRWIVCLITLSLAAGSAAESTGLPRLGEHTFVPVTDLEEPFLVTQVETRISLGRAINASVPIIDLADSNILGTTEADLLVAGIGFIYQHRVKDWLAVNVDLFTFGRIGTSTNTLLAEGVTGGLGYDIGWLMRIHQSRSFLLSGSLDLGNRAGTFVNLADWASGILEGTDVPLVRSRTSLGGSGGLRAAWGLSRRFGLLGDLTVFYRESFDGKGENEWDSDIRAAFSYDAQSDLKIPLGLALTGGYYEDAASSGESVEVWMWSLRLGLQGRDDFTIGLNFTTTYSTLGYNGNDMTLNQTTIDMRYYF